MLISLHIENYAIVEQLSLDFNQGMSTFTGETGAGKSIMIDALSLALGARAESSVVRQGSERCSITALFQFDDNSLPQHWLQQHDIPTDDNQLVLCRIITSEGRSKALINGQLSPLQSVRELANLLVTIHGQHQQQSLLNHQTHRNQLDNFAKHANLLTAVSEAYKNYQRIKQQIEQLRSQQSNADKVELLRYQVDELQQLNLQLDELEQLNKEHQRLHHAHDYLTKANQVLDLLHHNEAGNLNQGLNQSLQCLSELSDDDNIKAAREMLATALINVEEATNEIKQFESSVNCDPERLHQVENRLEAIHDVARKHHVEAKCLLEHQSNLEQELHGLLNASAQLEHLEKNLIEAEKAYQSHADKLSEARINQAKKLSRQITKSIQQLGMPKGIVEIKVTSLDKMHAHGTDKVEYYVCTNPGQAMDSLSKVASGGELSRISLAIEVITAQKASTPTLLFDEVDVGIGGATAAMVGQLLRELSQRLQVFCVTHQAQVASHAHQHYLVAKKQHAKTTFSTITLLTRQQRIDELARMLGGLTITESTRSNAEELLLD